MADSMELRSSNPPFDEEAAIGINASGGKPYRSSSDTLNHLLPAESAAPRPQPATPARDHRASIKEPQLPEVFTSVPEVRADILAVLVRKYDVEYNTAVETADRWRMATGGSLLSMEADQLSDIFGSELGRSLCDTIRHQQEDLKSQRRYTEAIYCALPILSLFALCLSGIYRADVAAGLFFAVLLALYLAFPYSKPRQITGPSAIIAGIIAVVTVVVELGMWAFPG